MAEPGFRQRGYDYVTQALNLQIMLQRAPGRELNEARQTEFPQHLGSYRLFGEAITFRKIYTHIFTNFQRTSPLPPGPHVEL